MDFQDQNNPAEQVEKIREILIGQDMQHVNERIEKLETTLRESNEAVSRKVNEQDHRGSHFYLALYWAQALAAQTEDVGLQQRFTPLAKSLSDAEATIVEELNAAQGVAVDIGGYYQPDAAKAAQAMRPSDTFNRAIELLNEASSE